MARITVADCIQVVPSRFELILLAAYRAKEISCGAPTLVERYNDKNAVIALREIASRKIDPKALREAWIQRHQKARPTALVDGPEEFDLSEEFNNMAQDMQSTIQEIEDSGDFAIEGEGDEE